jgi:hypothetical protein
MRLYGKPLLRNAEKFMISFWKELSWRFENAEERLEWRDLDGNLTRDKAAPV